jgi:hypothetical protein
VKGPVAKTPLAVVLCAWVVVAVPLGWGLYESVVKARPLFSTGAPPAADAVLPAPAPSK